MRNNIPHNWIEARTGELFEMVGGGTPSTKTSEYWNGDFPWITSADISEDHRITPRRTVSTRGIAESATNKVPVGTLIVATRVGLGKSAVAEAPMCFSQDCQGLIVPGKRLDSGFLMYQIETITSEFIRQSQGTTIRGITKKALADLKLRIAPTQEQHRIVEAIESYLTRLDAAVASLERVQRNLKRYRASVLKAAVEGRLVPTEAELAKKEGRSYEPASGLLKRILAGRCGLWEQAELARLEAQNRAPTGNRWKARYAEPAPPDVPRTAELPKGWCWSSLDQLTHFTVDYRGKTPPQSEAGIPTISAANVKRGRLVFDKPRFVSPEIYKQWAVRGLPTPGDLIVTTEAPVGETALFPETGVHLLTRRVIGLQTSEVNNVYLSYCFSGRIVRAHIESHNRGTTVPRILKPALLRTPIALPPTAEQARIVRVVETLLSLAERERNVAQHAITRCQRLRQSILKWAFEGKLVDQDPNDEPASVLLERIKAERESMQPQKRRRSGQRKKTAPVRHDEQLDPLGGSNK